MSREKQTHTERRAKRPRVDQNLPSDDLQNPDPVTPANNPAVEAIEKGSCSSGSNVQDAREPAQKRMRDFKGDITGSLLAQRKKRLAKDMHASFRILNANLDIFLKVQQKSRQVLQAMYSQVFVPLYQRWLEDVESSREQEEHLVNIYKEQQKFIHQSLGVQKKRTEELKDLCKQYLEKLVILSDFGGDSLVEELRCLITTLETKLLMLNHLQQIATSLLSLLDLLFS